MFARINFWRGLRGNGTYRVRLRRAGGLGLKARFQFHDLQKELQSIPLHAFEQRIVRKRLQLLGEFSGPRRVLAVNDSEAENRGYDDKVQIRAAGDKVFDGRADAIRGATFLQGESDFAIA